MQGIRAAIIALAIGLLLGSAPATATQPSADGADVGLWLGANCAPLCTLVDLAFRVYDWAKGQVIPTSAPVDGSRTTVEGPAE